MSLRAVPDQDAGWVWGVDTGALRCGLGFVDLASGDFSSNGIQWRTASSNVTLPASLDAAATEVERFARRMVEVHPPATIVFEKPMGRHSNPSLMFHAGVIVLALYRGTGLVPWPIGVTEWKKALVGDYQWPKDALLPWVAGLGYPIGDFDQAAAVAIAAAGAKLWAGFDVASLSPSRKPTTHRRVA